MKAHWGGNLLSNYRKYKNNSIRRGRP